MTHYGNTNLTHLFYNLVNFGEFGELFKEITTDFSKLIIHNDKNKLPEKVDTDYQNNQHYTKF